MSYYTRALSTCPSNYRTDTSGQNSYTQVMTLLIDVNSPQLSNLKHENLKTVYWIRGKAHNKEHVKWMITERSSDEDWVTLRYITLRICYNSSEVN